MAQKGGPRYRGQQLLDNAPCQAVVNLGSGALLFPINRALLVQHRPDRPAKGSPTRGAVERSETERFLRNIALTQRPPFGDCSSVRGSFLWVRRWRICFFFCYFYYMRFSAKVKRCTESLQKLPRSGFSFLSVLRFFPDAEQPPEQASQALGAFENDHLHRADHLSSLDTPL